MTKRDDNLHDAAERRIETEPLPGVRVGINLPAPGPRLHRIPGLVDDVGLSIIRRAIVLQLARLANLEEDSPEWNGQALTAICRTYLVSERDSRRPEP